MVVNTRKSQLVIGSGVDSEAHAKLVEHCCEEENRPH